MISETTNEDCMQMMVRYPDKWFELAIVDPPYGLDKKLLGGETGMMKNCFKQVISKEWDVKPSREYFIELFRVSKNHIIWGGNYFLEHLSSTQCFIIWDKMNGTNNMADAEIAWTSFNSSVRFFRLHHFSSGYGKKIHPTQKPVALYKWLMTHYAKQGDKILDTHLGSQSSRIAAWDLGFDFYGCELDEDYFREGNERFERHRAQPKLFAPEIEIPKQESFLDQC